MQHCRLEPGGFLDLVFAGSVSGKKANAVIFWGEKNGFSPERSQLIVLDESFGGGNWTNIGDVDGDGHLDLLICGDHSLVILKGGPAEYSKENSVMLPGLDPSACQLADLNGDGRLDIFLCNFQRNRDGVVPSYIYWNSPSGFNPDNKTELMTMGCTFAAIADLNNDGALDIMTAHYNTGTQRSLPCYIYWGSSNGIYSERKRSELPGESVCSLFITDLDQNGFKDVVFFNHTKDFDHSYGSFIYWGSPAGFSEKNRSLLPTFGVHYSATIDMGNIFSRRLEETYISAPVKIDAPAGSLALRWRAECPLGSTIQFQVRFAGSSASLAKSEWTGPAGIDSYFALAGQAVGIPLKGADWMQYRAVFRSTDGSNYPVLQEVMGELLVK